MHQQDARKIKAIVVDLDFARRSLVVGVAAHDGGLAVHGQSGFKETFDGAVETPNIFLEIGDLRSGAVDAQIDLDDLFCGGGKGVLVCADGDEYRRILLHGQRFAHYFVAKAGKELLREFEIGVVGEGLGRVDFFEPSHNAGKIDADDVFDRSRSFVDSRLVFGGEGVVGGSDDLCDVYRKSADLDRSGLFVRLGQRVIVEIEPGQLSGGRVLQNAHDDFVQCKHDRDQVVTLSEHVVVVGVDRRDHSLDNIFGGLSKHCVVGEFFVQSVKDVAESVELSGDVVVGRPFEFA